MKNGDQHEHPAKYVPNGKTFYTYRRCKIRCCLYFQRCGPPWQWHRHGELSRLQNFTGKISLKEFGEQFHLSEKYISRYFKEHFHITLSQYITYLRLENAKQLLQDTDLSVTETAMQSGYQNVSYFIRSFKKAYGISPLKYRNSGILTKI